MVYIQIQHYLNQSMFLHLIQLILIRTKCFHSTTKLQKAPDIGRVSEKEVLQIDLKIIKMVKVNIRAQHILLEKQWLWNINIQPNTNCKRHYNKKNNSGNYLLWSINRIKVPKMVMLDKVINLIKSIKLKDKNGLNS